MLSVLSSILSSVLSSVVNSVLVVLAKDSNFMMAPQFEIRKLVGVSQEPTKDRRDSVLLSVQISVLLSVLLSVLPWRWQVMGGHISYTPS